MARGPFAPVEQAPISDLRLEATTLPKSATEAGVGIANVVAAGVTKGVERVKKDYQDEISNELRTSIDVVEQGLAANRDPVVQQQVFDAAANGNPFFQRAKEEFIQIQDAVRQGKLPSVAARLRTRAALASAINSAPEFQDELRAVAKQASGFSPEAATFLDRLHEPVAGPKTGADKGEEAIQKLMAETQLPREVIIAGNRTAFVNKIEQSKINTAMLQGEANAASAASLADIQSSNMLLSVAANIQSQMKQNGGVYDAGMVMASVTQMGIANKQEVLAGLDPSTPVDIRSRISQQMDNHINSLRRMVEDGSLETIFTERNKGIQAMTLNGVLNMPDLAVLHEFGKDKLLEYVALMDKYKTPAQLEAARQFHPTLAAMHSLKQFAPAMSDAIKKQASGETLTTQDKILAGIFNNQVMQSKDSSSQEKNEALNNQIVNLGEASAFKAFDNAAMLMRVKEDPSMQKSLAVLFSNQYNSNVALVSSAVRELGVENIAIVDGKLDASAAEQKFSQAPGGVRSMIANHLETIAVANRMLSIGKTYKSAGILEWSGPEKFFADVTSAAGSAGAQPDKPRRRRFNPDTGTFEDVE